MRTSWLPTPSAPRCHGVCWLITRRHGVSGSCCRESRSPRSVRLSNAQMDAAATSAQKWESQAHRLGIDPGTSLADLVATAADAFPPRLDAQLADLNVDVVDPPDVPHMDLVTRASIRRRPCDDNGNGYRDTLIWLTLIELAKSTNDAVALVSDNYKDFGVTGAQSDDRSLHAQLIEDLEAAGLNGRVTWFRALDELVLSIAAQNSAAPTDDLRSVGDQLERDAVIEHISTQILPGLIGHAVDPDGCGLPLSATSGWITSIQSVDPNDIELTATESPSGESLVGFAFPATAEIDIDNHPDFGPLPDQPGGDPASLVKTLQFAGLVVRDRFHRPTDAEVTEIRAPDNDPGVAARRLRAGAGAPVNSATLAEALAAIQKMAQPSQAMLDTLAKMAQPSPAMLDTLAKMTQPSPAMLDTLAKMTQPSPAMRDTLAKMTQPSPAMRDTLAKIQKMTQPSPAMLDTLARIQKMAQPSQANATADRHEEETSERDDHDAEPDGDAGDNRKLDPPSPTDSSS
jgi:hypothetical protein